MPYARTITKCRCDVGYTCPILVASNITQAEACWRLPISGARAPFAWRRPSCCDAPGLVTKMIHQWRKGPGISMDIIGASFVIICQHFLSPKALSRTCTCKALFSPLHGHSWVSGEQPLHVICLHLWYVSNRIWSLLDMEGWRGISQGCEYWGTWVLHGFYLVLYDNVSANTAGFFFLEWSVSTILLLWVCRHGPTTPSLLLYTFVAYTIIYI